MTKALYITGTSLLRSQYINATHFDQADQKAKLFSQMLLLLMYRVGATTTDGDKKQLRWEIKGEDTTALAYQ